MNSLNNACAHILLLIGGTICNTVIADENINDFDKFNQWLAVEEDTLDQLRAGFVLSNGVVVDISFDRRLFINDMVKATSFFETPRDLQLVQNGKLAVDTGFEDNLFQSVIQNSLDDQVLKTLTHINVTIQNLELAQESIENNVFFSQFYNAPITP